MQHGKILNIRLCVKTLCAPSPLPFSHIIMHSWLYLSCNYTMIQRKCIELIFSNKEWLSKLHYIFTLTDEDDWNIVCSECSSLCALWEQLSCYLGLPPSLISNIKDNNLRDSSKCWNSSLHHWINQNYNTAKFGLPSWRTLLSAIAKVDKRHFKQLVAGHQSTKLGI